MSISLDYYSWAHLYKSCELEDILVVGETFSTRFSTVSHSPSLSQYSDENMMDAGNLAIVFGPTLLPTPDTLDQVACQAHVNEVIKTVILHHDNIFPDTKELPGPVYEKCMTGDQYW